MTKLYFVIDLDNINDIQLCSMRRTIERAKHAHWINVEFRINGKDEYAQADWLKHFVETGRKPQ